MQILERLMDVLYPPACFRCHERTRHIGSVFCASCEADLPATSQRFRTQPGAAIDEALAPCDYAGSMPEAMKMFKYRHQWRVGARLAEKMTDAFQRSAPPLSVDVVVPVPLHWLKRRLRGFQPTEELAACIAGRIDRPLALRLLRRRRWTATQTKLSQTARQHNVRGAFAVRGDVAGLRVLLIDDVLTSGATADACALALKTAGAAHVTVLTAARAP